LGYVHNCCGFVTNKTDCWLGSSLFDSFQMRCSRGSFKR